ncbi:hypothetical protein [Streptomyces sp. KR55]
MRRTTATADGKVPDDELLLLPPVLTVRESSGPGSAVASTPGRSSARTQ